MEPNAMSSILQDEQNHSPSPDLTKMEQNSSDNESPTIKLSKTKVTIVNNKQGSYSKKKTTSPCHLATKKESTLKKNSSGIPLRTKSGSVTKSKPILTCKSSSKPVSNHNNNKYSLELQFNNNKKKLAQMCKDSAERQRPLMELHKSLLRAKKELEEMGKKVTYDEFKLTTLTINDKPAVDTSDQNELPSEEADNVRIAMENIIENMIQLAKKYLVKRHEAVKTLENIAISETATDDISTEVATLNRENKDLEQQLDIVINENYQKLNELTNSCIKLGKGNAQVNVAKIQELEKKLEVNQKLNAELEEKLNIANRKTEQRSNNEKLINELNEKNNKLNEDIQNQKRLAAGQLAKLRNTTTELEKFKTKCKEAEDKDIEANNRLKLLQDAIRKKELEWIKEKEEFKIQRQKFLDKQKQIDARASQQTNFIQRLEDQLSKTSITLEERIRRAEGEIEELTQKNIELEMANASLKQQVDQQKQFAENGDVSRLPPEKRPEFLEYAAYEQKLKQAEANLSQQTEFIGKLQAAIKAHAQLAVGLKFEKERAFKYVQILRQILKEAKDEITNKNKIIDSLHEELQIKEYACQKIKNEMKDLESEIHEFPGDQIRQQKPLRCQLCMTPVTEVIAEEETILNTKEDTSKLGNKLNWQLSKSLMTMSVQKVDNIRAKVETLKKMCTPPTKFKCRTAGKDRRLLYQKQRKLGDKSSNIQTLVDLSHFENELNPSNSIPKLFDFSGMENNNYGSKGDNLKFQQLFASSAMNVDCDQIKHLIGVSLESYMFDETLHNFNKNKNCL